MSETALAPRDERAPAGYDGNGAMPDYRAGTAALAAMEPREFETRLAMLKAGRERIAQIHRELMDKETDFGIIPGTDKPTLLKPGAEKLCDFYRLAAEFRPAVSYGDGETSPPITVITECRLHLGTLDGPVVSTGHGAASSWEKRYRYRRGERSCPSCGTVGTIFRSKDDRGGWFCWRKRGGCGKEFPERAPEIVNQEVGNVDNPDPYDLLNTLLKMSEKRAHVDATLRATATSGLYSQDMEEQAAAPEPEVADTDAFRRRFFAMWAKDRPDAGDQDMRDWLSAALEMEVDTRMVLTPAEWEQAVLLLMQLRRGGGPGRAEQAVRSAETESYATQTGAAPPKPVLTCSSPDCGKSLTKGQHDVSMRAFSQPLCPDCQRQQARAA